MKNTPASPFKPRALAPYMRAKDLTYAATLDYKGAMHTIQVNDIGRVVWAKDFDHEDVTTEFHLDQSLNFVANVLASLGVFCVFMIFIALAMQVPPGALAWLVLTVWGL